MRADFECIERSLVERNSCPLHKIHSDFLPECVSRFRGRRQTPPPASIQGTNPPPAVKRPDIYRARGIVLAAIKLDIRKRQVRYPRMEIDLHTMTGGEIGGGIWRGVGREFVAMLWDRRVGWVEEEGRGRSNSPPGTDDKALVSETKNRSIPRASFVVEESFAPRTG